MNENSRGGAFVSARPEEVRPDPVVAARLEAITAELSTILHYLRVQEYARRVQNDPVVKARSEELHRRLRTGESVKGVPIEDFFARHD